MTQEEKIKEIIKISDTNQLYDVVDFNALHESLHEDLIEMAKWKDKQLWLLIDAIDHAYLQTDGTYGELSYEVSDKVKYLKRAMKGE